MTADKSVIEAMARAMMAASDRDGMPVVWDAEPEILREAYRKQVRAALTALNPAAPPADKGTTCLVTILGSGETLEFKGKPMSGDQIAIEKAAEAIRATAVDPDTVCCFENVMCATPPCACAKQLATAALTALQQTEPDATPAGACGGPHSSGVTAGETAPTALQSDDMIQRELIIGNEAAKQALENRRLRAFSALQGGKLPDAFAMSLRSIANRERSHNDNPELADIIDCAANEIDRLSALQGDAGMRAFSASDAACYLWPEDTDEHKALRMAYIRGAASTALQQPLTPIEQSATFKLLKAVENSREVPIDPNICREAIAENVQLREAIDAPTAHIADKRDGT